MPCNSDYCQASGQELESVRVCSLLVYLYEKTSKEIPDWVSEAAKDCYGNVNKLDEATRMLCAAVRALTVTETEKYLYDGRSSDARKLASWWERHQEWDLRRVAEEDAEKAKQKTIEGAKAKLTPEEIEALGI